MAKGIDTGSEFFTGVLARLAPEERQKGEELMAQLRALGGGTVVAAVGDGVLAQQEFSRRSDELRTQTEELQTRAEQLAAERERQEEVHRQQTQWWQANQEALREAQRLKQGNGNGNGQPNGQTRPQGDQPVPGVTLEQVQALLQQQTAGVLGFANEQGEIFQRHLETFGTLPNLNKLLTHPQLPQLQLKGVYELVYKDQLEAKAAELQKQRDDKLRAEGAAEALSKHQSLPYPVGTDGFGPGTDTSPLSVLTGPTDGTVDKAVAHWQQIQADRMAGKV